MFLADFSYCLIDGDKHLELRLFTLLEYIYIITFKVFWEEFLVYNEMADRVRYESPLFTSAMAMKERFADL